MSARVVMWHEIWCTVRSKGFLLATFGAPLFIIGGFLSILILSSFAQKGIESRFEHTIGVVDRSGLLSRPGAVFHGLSSTNVVRYEFPKLLSSELEGDPRAERRDSLTLKRLYSLQIGRDELAQGSIGSLVVLPDSYLDSPAVELYSQSFDILTVDLERRIAVMLRQNLARSSGADPRLLGALDKPIDFRELPLGSASPAAAAADEPLASGQAISFMLAAALIMVLTMYCPGAYFSLREERESKLIDVLLSSVRVEVLLRGKVLATVGAALIQITIWGAMCLTALLIFPGLAAGLMKAEIRMPRLVLACLFGLLGLVFANYCSILLGSIFSNLRDSQAASRLVKLFESLQMIVAWVVALNIDSPISVVLSIVPVFSPPAMIVRLLAGEVGSIEICLSLGLLAVAVLLAERIAARLFRASLLIYGKGLQSVALARALFSGVA